MREVKTDEDLREIYPGKVVTLKSCLPPGVALGTVYPSTLFTVIDTRCILAEGGGAVDLPVENAVTLVTVDQRGVPHTVVVSAYALVLL